MTRYDWASILPHASEIVESYESGVTLRQVFYRLVANATLRNDVNAYKGLSRETAKARREGFFPDLIDQGRQIVLQPHWTSPKHAMESLIQQYRLDRASTQDFTIILGVEKNTMVEQLSQWFGDLGVPVVLCVGTAARRTRTGSPGWWRKAAGRRS